MKSDGNSLRNNHQITNGTTVRSEWEDNILFDADDPDFCVGQQPPQLMAEQATAANNSDINMINTLIFRVPSATMSLGSVQTAPHLSDLCTPISRSNLSLSSSLSDIIVSSSPSSINFDAANDNNMLTIEELRAHIGSCFTCGVSWTDDHVSLDCQECGGYSTKRTCPLCDGNCGESWQRDFSMSHAMGKARWIGICQIYPPSVVVNHHHSSSVTMSSVTPSTCSSNVASQLLAQELCVRLEKLSST